MCPPRARHAFERSTGQRVEKLLLTITDNGIGFDAETLLNTASLASTLGLRGMQERALP